MGTLGRGFASSLMFKSCKTIFTNRPTVFRAEYVLKRISICLLIFLISSSLNFYLSQKSIPPSDAHIYEFYPKLLINHVFIISDRVMF
jgi:hypothetical protein